MHRHTNPQMGSFHLFFCPKMAHTRKHTRQQTICWYTPSMHTHTHTHKRHKCLFSSQSKLCWESLTFHMTFCHFASDILNMLLRTFVSSLVCWVLNKAELLKENTKKASMRKTEDGETERDK